VKRNILILVAAAVMVGGFVIAMLAFESREMSDAQSTAKLNSSNLVREYSPMAGNADARVTIVEFFDPACGTCRAFHPIVKNILRDNPGKVNLVVRYLPLHPGSADVVKILEAARLQGKFWEALETAYATQAEWAINHQAYPDLFWRSISSVGLDPEQVSRDMQSPAVSQNIQQDTEDGQVLGVDKTPGFFVNGKPLVEFGQIQLLRLVHEALESEYGDN
jgi:protein-disulfide isomerase